MPSNYTCTAKLTVFVDLPESDPDGEMSDEEAVKKAIRDLFLPGGRGSHDVPVFGPNVDPAEVVIAMLGIEVEET